MVAKKSFFRVIVVIMTMERFVEFIIIIILAQVMR